MAVSPVGDEPSKSAPPEESRGAAVASRACSAGCRDLNYTAIAVLATRPPRPYLQRYRDLNHRSVATLPTRLSRSYLHVLGELPAKPAVFAGRRAFPVIGVLCFFWSAKRGTAI